MDNIIVVTSVHGQHHSCHISSEIILIVTLVINSFFPPPPSTVSIIWAFMVIFIKCNLSPSSLQMPVFLPISPWYSAPPDHLQYCPDIHLSFPSGIQRLQIIFNTVQIYMRLRCACGRTLVALSKLAKLTLLDFIK
ncbi:hypothetical protein BsWGS_27443 [Bradybaena similaris]